MMTDAPRLPGPIFELLKQMDQLAELSQEIQHAAARIAALQHEHEQEEGDPNDRPHP